MLSAFVYKVAKFITWPQINESKFTDHFDLCVVDNVAFSQSLKKAVKSRQISNLRVHVVNVVRELDLNHCHLLYFQNVKKEILKSFLKEVEGKPIMTVASIPDFIDLGGMIVFERNKNKINISINNAKAKKSDLTISAHLLRLNKVKP